MMLPMPAFDPGQRPEAGDALSRRLDVVAEQSGGKRDVGLGEEEGLAEDHEEEPGRGGESLDEPLRPLRTDSRGQRCREHRAHRDEAAGHHAEDEDLHD
jgi:hypothetical protein